MKINLLLAFWVSLECIIISMAQRDDTCQDEKGSYCRGIGQRKSLSRCYNGEDRCCATCRPQRLDIPGCSYGDREGWCASIGRDRPISDCYSHSDTCCQTCAIFKSDNTGCPFGDKLKWCTEIGSRYLISSCYDKESSCCDTCSRFRQENPECPYGDRETYCPWIDAAYCETNANRDMCCHTCAILTTTTTSTTTTTTTPTPTTTSSQVNSNSSMSVMLKNADSSSPITYTGSPGRPDDVTQLAADGGDDVTIIHSPDNVSHAAEFGDINVPRDIGDPTPSSGNSSTNNTDISLVKIICFHNDTEHHRIRHDKHGGRHRSRDHGQIPLNIVCINVTVNSTENSTTLLGPDSPPGSTAPSANTSTQRGIAGDKDFQEGVVYGSCGKQTTGIAFIVVALLHFVRQHL